MISLPLLPTLGVIAWIAIGYAFAYFMAINATAVVVLLVFWPVFGLLILASPLVNRWANRDT